MTPIDMILFCPACNTQHIDAPDTPSGIAIRERNVWTNPPHRTHQCHECWHLWRPSDHATNGVLHLASNRPDEMRAPQVERMAALKRLQTTLNAPMLVSKRVYVCGCEANGPGVIPDYCPRHGTPP